MVPVHTTLLPQSDDHSGQPISWDTELLKGSRDAGLLGLLRHPGVEELRTLPRNWDTELLKGTRDAGLSGLHQHPEVEGQRMPSCERDTKVPQGLRDANPLGTRHPRIDEPPAQTKSLVQIDKLFQQPTHWNTESPKDPPEVDKTQQQWHLESSLFNYLNLRHPKFSLKTLRTNSVNNYSQGSGELDHQAQPGINTSAVLSLASADAPSDPLDKLSR